MNQAQRPNSPAKAKSNIGRKVSLAELVARHLLRARTTAAALGRKAKLNKSILSKILSGQQTFLLPESVDKLAKATGIPAPKIYAAIRASKSDSVDNSEIERCIDRSKSLSHNR